MASESIGRNLEFPELGKMNCSVNDDNRHIKNKFDNLSNTIFI